MYVRSSHPRISEHVYIVSDPHIWGPRLVCIGPGCVCNHHMNTQELGEYVKAVNENK